MATLKTWNGLASASLKSYNGLAKASWKTWNGMSVAASDPYWASVVLLAENDNAADGTTTFIDQSASAHTITGVGNVQYDTAQAPSGMTSSVLYDGNGDAATLDGSADFAYGTADFTLEGAFRLAAVNAQQCLVDHRPTSTQGLYPGVFVLSTNNLVYFQSSAVRITGATTVAVDTWYWWALSRVSGTTRLYLGTIAGGTASQEGSDYTDSNNYIVGASRPILGDSGFGSDSDLNGWKCSDRYTKGVGRYSGASFTIPTLPLPTS